MINSDSTVSLAAIGLVTTILALVVTPLFRLLGANTKAQNDTTEAMKALVKETAKGNREAKQRNGHLGEQNIQITKLITQQSPDIAAIKASNEKVADILSKSAIIAAEDRDFLTGSKTQVIKEQHVEHQVIEGAS